MRRALPAVLIAAAGALASYGALTAASSPPIASQSNAVTVLRFRQAWDGDRLIPNASVVIRGSGSSRWGPQSTCRRAPARSTCAATPPCRG